MPRVDHAGWMRVVRVVRESITVGPTPHLTTADACQPRAKLGTRLPDIAHGRGRLEQPICRGSITCTDCVGQKRRPFGVCRAYRETWRAPWRWRHVLDPKVCVGACLLVLVDNAAAKAVCRASGLFSVPNAHNFKGFFWAVH